MKKAIPAKAGTTLVEVVVAILLLSILALAGAASLSWSRSTVAIQKSRRMAVEIASSRLEEIRAAPYTAVRPALNNYTTYFLSRTTGVWVVTAADPGETVEVNGRPRAMRTTVRYIDTDGGSSSYDALQVSVRVAYHGSANSVVQFDSVKAP
ncbi:MAG TPA: hypothetical protein PKE12_06085 [Kiritimatiellia bacterium]|nr:hypothetical protein [Kiritimatiellia bacterium]